MEQTDDTQVNAVQAPCPNGNDEAKNINEEHKVWRKNTPFLYDGLLTRNMEWPSLTLQWMPHSSSAFTPPDGQEPVMLEDGQTVHTLLLGTNTSGQDKDYIILAEVMIPEWTALEKVDQETPSRPLGKLRIRQKICHEGEVNRARYMPNNSNIIATHGPDSSVYVFDISKHPLSSSVPNPQMTLRGHTEEGYALSWHPSQSGRLLSGAYDNTICMWDVDGKSDPVRSFLGHTDKVEDVTWHPNMETIFSTVGDDRRLLIWDTRKPSNTKAALGIDAHDDAVNCVDYDPFSDFLLATGSSDKTVVIWDTRCLDRPLHTLESHEDGVYSVQWSPKLPGVLASGGDDRRTIVWDVKKVGEEQSPEDAEDGTSEMLFAHGGHKSAIKDIGWSPEDPWMCGSTDENNAVHCWQVAKKIIGEEDTEVDPTELE